MAKMELTLTEKELIELTIQFGYDGRELSNTHFIRKGYLKNNDTYKAFMKKVDTICDSWIKLRKKKGKPTMYKLSGLREEASSIEDRRSNNGLTNDDVIMREYIFNRLCNMKINDARSYYEWAVECGLVNVAELPFLEMKSTLSHLYEDNKIEKLILNKFIDTIKKRNKDVVINAFKWLEKNKYIECERIHMKVNYSDKKEVVSKELYHQFRYQFTKLLKKYGLKENYYYWKKANSFMISGNEAEAFNEIDELYSTYEIKSIFIATKVNLLHNNMFSGARRETCLQAYSNKLMILTDKQQQKKWKSNFDNEKYYAFNTYTLMQFFPFKIENFSFYRDKYSNDLERIEVDKVGRWLQNPVGESHSNDNENYSALNSQTIKKDIDNQLPF